MGLKGTKFPLSTRPSACLTRKISIFPDSGRLISIVWLDGRRLLIGLHITSSRVHARRQLHILRGGRATSECPVEFSHPILRFPSPDQRNYLAPRKGQENRCQLCFLMSLSALTQLIALYRFREKARLQKCRWSRHAVISDSVHVIATDITSHDFRAENEIFHTHCTALSRVHNHYSNCKART
jgi:hypothetical protein